MKITTEIKSAIEQAVQHAGNNYRFSRLLEKIKPSTIRNWINGETVSVSDDNWAILYPHICNYLPESSIAETVTAIQSEEIKTGTTDTRISAAEMLKFWLKTKGHTQTSVAPFLGITQQAIQAQLSGKTKLTAAMVYRYAEILNIPEKATQEIIAALHNGDASLAAAINNLAAAISKLADTMEVAK